jgi:1,4-dihydroxy-6-naphthoate synthase
MKVRLAFSPDSDDAFMFHALLHGRIDSDGLELSHERADTESLNALADTDRADVLAVSIARYATIADRWLLLPHGMSVGRNYGPVVVALPESGLRSLADLEGKRVGIPGHFTTAWLALRLLAPPVAPIVIPIAPFERVFQSLRAREVDAAILIHEGRLTFEREGFALVADLGVEWMRREKLPLPLGANVVRRALGREAIARISSACSASIAWALDHREEVMDTLSTPLDREGLDRYLSLYANSDTRALQPDVKQAIEVMLTRGADRGLIPRVCPEYAP